MHPATMRTAAAETMPIIIPTVKLLGIFGVMTTGVSGGVVPAHKSNSG